MDIHYMDVQYTDILIEGEKIPDDENFFHSVPKLDAPHSAPHSRSSSFKNRPRPKLNLDIQLAQRPRTNSLPNAYLPLPDQYLQPEPHGVQRVRSFKTTSKGLINHGDSFKKSTNSLISAGSAGSISEGSNKVPRKSSCVSNDSGPNGEEIQIVIHPSDLPIYKVLMMGASGVGKSALTRQFMTSEYKGTYIESPTPEADVVEPERNVNVLLDEQESTLQFLDEEQFPDMLKEDLSLDAYVVVFSVSDTSSYNYAVKTIRTLREVHKTHKAIILVGNKIDLARQRRVARHDALRIAKKFDCGYIETSAALNHHVDELLVGILSQIREHVSHTTPNLSQSSESKNRSRSKSPGKAITEFFSKIFGAHNKKAKSCETLFVQ